MQVQFSLLRYNPGNGKSFWQSFTIPQVKGMTVLDGLHSIKENLDGSLAYRHSCRMGICGSCGMFINGLPRLACQAQIADFKAQTIKIASLPNFPKVKDLVPNLDAFFNLHREVKPYLIRRDPQEVDNPIKEFLQLPKELEDYLQFSYCIKCGLCLAACPTVATDPQFLGPQALAQVYRYNRDSRDEGGYARAKIIDRSHGVFNCHFAGACSEACPKGVDPALAIQLLKWGLFRGRWKS